MVRPQVPSASAFSLVRSDERISPPFIPSTSAGMKQTNQLACSTEAGEEVRNRSWILLVQAGIPRSWALFTTAATHWPTTTTSWRGRASRPRRSGTRTRRRATWGPNTKVRSRRWGIVCRKSNKPGDRVDPPGGNWRQIGQSRGHLSNWVTTH